MKTQILLAAAFFYFLNSANAQPGKLDPTFRNSGIVKTGLGKNYNYQVSYVRQILPQANGDMYVVQGPFTGWEDEGKKSLTRRHSNGSIDISFGLQVNGFSADAGFDISRVAIEPDGKIIAVGSVEPQKTPDAEQSNFALAKFKTDGSLDSSFSHDGKLTTDFSEKYDEDGYLTSWDKGYGIAIQKDGKIVAAGYSNDYLALARYNPDGSLDKTFNGNGLLTTNIYHSFGYPTPVSIAFQSDGKIVVTGGFSVIARFNIDGSTDLIFSGGDNYSFVGIYTEAIQKDGKIIVNDYSSHGLGLARYNTDGTLDNSFSQDGTQQLDWGTEVLVQEDQKIIVAGDSIGGYFTIRRFNPDGSLDNTFSNDGRQETDFGFGYNQPYAAALQADGKLLVAGAAMPYIAIARYNTDGSLDNTFDKDGKLTDRSHLGKASYNKTFTQKDGKIVASGKAWNGSGFEYVIARYNTNGHLDRSFSGNGILTTGITTTSDDESAFAIALQSDEKIVAAMGNYILRYNADGSADNTFSNDGKHKTNSVINILDVTIQNDGKIVTAGNSYFKDEYGYDISKPSVARYNTDGSVDKPFGTNGRQAFESSDEGTFRSIAIQNDGKIVAAGIVTDGYYDGNLIVSRLNTNGSFDGTFGGSGTVSPSIGANSCDVAIQSDGKIVVAGSGDDHDTGNTDIARLNSNGTVDNSFQANGAFEYYKSASNTSIAVQDDGKVVVSGIELFRLNTNGSRDTTFNTKAAQEVDFEINDIAVSNNKLYAVGGQTSGVVARYLLDNNNTPPVVSITSPDNNAVYVAPATITIHATASDPDGTVYSVRFYNGKKYVKTDFTSPYTYTLSNLSVGTYTLTAKATDYFGAETTSAPVTITVQAPNQAPAVSIISPADNQTYADPANIRLVASAADTDGRITKVEFYNGATLLATQSKYPYTYLWKNVPAGTYVITARATDNQGAQTTSESVTIKVTSDKSMVSARDYLNIKKTASNDALRLRLSPNPASNMVNIYTSGLQQSKPATVSIISVSGIVLKTMRISNAATQIDVSSLASGVYTIKIVSGEKVLYKKFVKL